MWDLYWEKKLPLNFHFVWEIKTYIGLFAANVMQALVGDPDFFFFVQSSLGTCALGLLHVLLAGITCAVSSGCCVKKKQHIFARSCCRKPQKLLKTGIHATLFLKNAFIHNFSLKKNMAKANGKVRLVIFFLLCNLCHYSFLLFLLVAYSLMSQPNNPVSQLPVDSQLSTICFF